MEFQRQGREIAKTSKGGKKNGKRRTEKGGEYKG